MENQFTNDEVLELDIFIRYHLSNIMHLRIGEMDIINNNIVLSFHTTPVHLNKPFYSYKIYIWFKNDIYYVEYQEAYHPTFLEKPIVTTESYKIEDFNDVMNVLEDIFDTLGPRDEY